MSLEEIKASADHPCHGLLDTARNTLRYLEGSWQYQIFNNLDELKNVLVKNLSPAELAEFEKILELTVKNPLRRQIGRVRAISRSLDEINRYLS
jgi:hypothetical protein